VFIDGVLSLKSMGKTSNILIFGIKKRAKNYARAELYLV